VSIRKVSNKRLSRNLKIRKTPLRVLPLSTFHIRHRAKHTRKKHMIKETETTFFPPSQIHGKVEQTLRSTGKNVKKCAKKLPITVKPLMRLHVTMNALRWLIVIVFIYIAAGTMIVMIQDGTESLKNIVIYSIMGFFTFFMGYLGWILARDVLMMISGRKSSHNEYEIES
jgi:hypothetical protein